MSNSIKDYSNLLQKFQKSSPRNFFELEILLCVAISFGVPLDMQTDEMVALVTIRNWQYAPQNKEGKLIRFYTEYVADDLITTTKVLEKTADSQLYGTFIDGQFNRENHNNQAKINQWIDKVRKSQQWIAKNTTKIEVWKNQILKKCLPKIQEALKSPMLPLPEACLEYSEIYARTIGDEKSDFTVIKCAAENNITKAKFLLSEFYHFGIGTRKNARKSTEWCQRAAAEGYPDAEFILAETLSANATNNLDYKKAFNWYSLAAEHQHAGANLILGLAYGSGKFIKKDAKRAVNYFTRAIELGEAEAYYYLAVHYEKGDGVVEDPATAVEYYSLAAVLGSDFADKYLNHKITIEDYCQAKQHHRDVERNNPAALYLEGCFCDNLIEHGEGFDSIERDREDYFAQAAKIWLEQAEAGNPKSQMLIGLCYLNGHGVAENGNKASKWLQKSAENGCKRALYHIGEMYHLGDNIELSDRKANHYFIAAAEGGDADAMQKLGDSYLEGYGVKKDLQKAMTWFEKAAALGNTCAERNLAYCEENFQNHPEHARIWRVKAALQGDRTAQVSLAERISIPNSQIKQDFEQIKHAYEFAEYYDDILEEIKSELAQPEKGQEQLY